MGVLPAPLRGSRQVGRQVRDAVPEAGQRCGRALTRQVEALHLAEGAPEPSEGGPDEGGLANAAGARDIDEGGSARLEQANQGVQIGAAPEQIDRCADVPHGPASVDVGRGLTAPAMQCHNDSS